MVHALGLIEVEGFVAEWGVIQAPQGVWHGPLCSDGRSMGEDGAALPGQARRSGPDRDGWGLFLEAVLWIARTSSPWPDLPSAFGKWNTGFKRYREWVKADVFATIFAGVSDEPDLECAMVDGTIVKVHRHGQGAKIL